MFAKILSSGIPVLQASTTDIVYLLDEIKVCTKKTVKPWGQVSQIAKDTVYVHICKSQSLDIQNLEKLYPALAMANSQMVIVNGGNSTSCAVNAGTIPVNQKVLKDLLKKSCSKEEQFNECWEIVKNLTRKEMLEVIRLAQVLAGTLSRRTLHTAQSVLRGSTTGIEFVYPKLNHYVNEYWLSTYAKKEKDFFVGVEASLLDPRLIPRGMLLHGKPGVGKTMAAKYLADYWGVPLFRLNMGSVKEKWVGSSEDHFTKALARVDNESPCVLLLDEIEKILSGESDSGVTENLLALFLWWLQEHQSKVFVVMTTNDLKRLPEELYRPGRIDGVFEMKGILNLNSARHFWIQLAQTYDKKVLEPLQQVYFEKLEKKEYPVSQADIEQMLIHAIKESIRMESFDKA